MIPTNEADWDRALRIFVGLLLLYAGWSAWPGATAIVLLAPGIVAVGTGAGGRSPAYSLFHVTTKKAAIGTWTTLT